ncbi:restriction endonuclease subunit S [Listeria monocytogenes]|nr:restriction endonuclease subunit S [Listeria monocytogenes]
MSNDTQPEIRFPGFTEDWEQRKLSDIVIRLSKTSNSNQLPKVEFEDIIAGEGRLNKDISNKIDERKGILFEPQDILYGKLRPYLKNWLFTDFNGIALGDFWVFRSINVEPKFIYSLIQSYRYQRVANDTAGTKMPRSDWKKVSSTYFSISKSIEEQKKIGSFFKQLDDTIALHQRKLDLLKETKKGFLQKMFPKNGAKVPEIRFPGFTEDWEERKLRDITERVRGNDGRMDLPTLTISASSGWLDQRDRFSGNIAGKEQKNYTLLKKGQLSYNHGNSKLAKYGVVCELTTYDEALVPRVFHSFDTNELASSNFIEYMFATKRPDRELAKLVSSGARMDGLLNINFDEFMGINVSVPSVEEQQKIGAFFKQLDDTITLHQRKLDLLKETKKGFLQKMFV